MIICRPVGIFCLFQLSGRGPDFRIVAERLGTDQDKKVAVYCVAIPTLLDLPCRMADMQIHCKPDAGRMPDINWRFAAACCEEHIFRTVHIVAFIHQVSIYILDRSGLLTHYTAHRYRVNGDQGSSIHSRRPCWRK